MIDRPEESRAPHRPRRVGLRFVVRVSVRPETSDQVVLANGAKFAPMQVRTVRGLEIELVGSTFFPKQCHLQIEWAATPAMSAESAGAPSKRLTGIVRRSQTISPEPLHSIWVQVAGSDPSLLSEVQAAFVAGPEVGKEPIAVDSPDPAASNDDVPGEESLVSRAIDLGVPFVDPRMFDIQFANGALLPEDLVRRHRLFPLFCLSGAITLGMENPSDLAAIDHVRLRTGHQVEACLCSVAALDALIVRAYHAPATGQSVDDSAPETAGKPGDTSAQASSTIVHLVRALLEESVRDGASDIHIEPERDFTRVRLRVDGILHEKSTQPSERHAGIVSRIKVMSKLDISEVRRPQDGHFSLTLNQRTLDVRVSTIPTIYGENVVLRLLLSGGKVVGLDELGMPAWALKNMEGFLEHPNGMILVAGPTGSGKTTTLYAALARLNTMDRNVVTVEDPVERRVALLRQTQVNPKAGVTFASGLRSILRQDPDVIMVGEIRDRETAEIAVHAALTGHLVLSTLHTNTAAGAIVRLSEMGIPPFLITSSLRAVISQRLTRRICSECRESVVPDARLVAGVGFKPGERVSFMAGAGCARCLQTGYKGRVGIYEMLQVTPALGRTLLGGERDEIEKEGNRALICGLREDGLQKIRDGLTTVEEIARIVGLEQGDAVAETGA